MSNEECIFCQIVQKKVPASVVYEDEKCLAFLDINPLTLGHTLVIPKKHEENIFDIDEELLKHIISVAKRIGENMKKKAGIEGVNIFQASGTAAEQSILHFHLHVIPRKTNDGLNINEWWRTKARRAEKEDLDKVVKLLRLEEVKHEERRETRPRSEEEVKRMKRMVEVA